MAVGIALTGISLVLVIWPLADPAGPEISPAILVLLIGSMIYGVIESLRVDSLSPVYPATPRNVS